MLFLNFFYWRWHIIKETMKNALVMEHYFLSTKVGWKVPDWCYICCWWLFSLIGSMHCNTDGSSMWITRKTMLNIKPHLVTFHETIFLFTHPSYIYIYISFLNLVVVFFFIFKKHVQHFVFLKKFLVFYFEMFYWGG